MAGLISTGIWGFICSMLPTGKRDEEGRLEMEEHFLSGFAGWGWKIWKTVAGFFRLEIDELVVRRTMTVFELMIHKIRAIIGAYAITQGNGKIKSVVLSTDGTEYLIALEDKYMSLVEYDFIRCQEFDGGQKLYHVEIASILEGVIHVPVSEFEGSSVPEPGDEIIQFGNSSHDEKYAGRHSAIYIHADESGQPAMDVMFDIYSKDWTGCVKVRVGGDIPGSGGLKGFYCENGMIKCVDKNKHTTYCLYPDGTAELGDGAAIFRPDKSGHIAGGAIKWEWNEDRKKFVCTMGDVLLTWDNLSDEVKENLKGEPGKGTDGEDGKDANLLPWVEEWNNNQTEIDGEFIVSPKMFSGTKSADGKLTGIAQGKDCITIDGVKRTGIFALVDNEVVFELDPITKRYLFRGRIEADEGIFRGKIETARNGKRIVIDPENIALAYYDEDNNESVVIDSGISGSGRILCRGRIMPGFPVESVSIANGAITVDDGEDADINTDTKNSTVSVFNNGIRINDYLGHYLDIFNTYSRNGSNKHIIEINSSAWPTNPSEVSQGGVYVENGFLKVKP